MTLSASALRVGLIGFGYAGKTLHAPLLRTTEGLALTVVGSSRPEAVHAVLPEVEVCAPEAVPTHPEVDLVVIATPNPSHFPLAAAALRAGKHVVLDKPFTVTLAEARELAAIAREHNRVLSVFHNRRWDSEVLATRAVLDSGVLGTVTHYECHMDRFRPTVRRRWREDPGPGAGLWFDLGPHLIDLALHLFGLPEAVSASFATLRPGGQTEDWAHVQLVYKHLRVILNATLLAAPGGARTTLHGTHASWRKYGIDTQEAQLQAGMLPTDPAFGLDPDPGILTDGATGARTEIPAPPGNQRLFYSGVRDAILTTAASTLTAPGSAVTATPPPVTAAQAVAVMAVLETTFASAAQGRILPLPLTPEERTNA